MLTGQRPISWRRKWLRWQRQLQRFQPLIVAVSLGLVLVFILYKTLLSSYAIEQEMSALSKPSIVPKLSPVPATSTVSDTKQNPRPAIAPLPETTALSVHHQKTVVQSALKLPDSEILSFDQKREAVKSAILHAWSGYKKDAFGHDELLPLSHSFADNWGSLAWTLIDSIGTLFICSLTEEYNIARDFIANIRFNEIHSDVSVFETNIRILGGLLSAFDLSGDSMFIEQAKVVGDALLPAFSTSSGFPSPKVNLATGRQSGAWLGMDTVILSEIGSLQMELSTLSHLTDDPKYMRAALKVYETLMRNTAGGLLPTQFSLSSGLPLNRVYSLGAYSDSYYEYLLKLYILSDRSVPAALNMYLKAVDEMLELLIVEWTDLQSMKRRARIVQRDGDVVEERMEHLTCFMPGMLALGAFYGERHNIESLIKRKDRHMELAISLLDTCISMYSMTTTQLSGESIEFREDEFRISNDPRYLLRPETVESLFILYRITKNVSYRDAGWHIFSAIEKHCKTDTAYAAVENVNSFEDPAGKLDNMESFVMAETFKYLYLLFSPETLIPLEHFVFTTEAHPLRIMKGSKIQLFPEF